MTTPDQGTPVAEGIYSYTIDDRPNANEIWRMTRLSDGRLHTQTILRTEQRIIYGMDLVRDGAGAPTTLEVRLESQGAWQASLAIASGAVQGQIKGPQGTSSVQVALPLGALFCPEAISLRYALGQALDLTPEAEQTVPLCLVPVVESRGQPLVPHVVAAHTTVLGMETVDLLMAEVPAMRVLIEWPDAPPQHAWFDERRFPIQWCWVRTHADGTTAQHMYSLTRYAWH